MAAKSILDDPILRDVPVVDGYKVLDPCVIYDRVGKGGMGAVFRGLHVRFNIDVGIKCLHPHLADGSDDLIQRFEREAQLAAMLNHPNVVRVYDVDCKHNIHFLVMEFVAGETCRDRVHRKGSIDVEEAVAIVLDASRGLAAAHEKGIVHRDVKPDNILISTEGVVKLADLGLGNIMDVGGGGGGGLTMSQMALGTPRYMPPEQWEGLNKVGQPGDIWAMGATLYYLLAGKDAFEAESLTTIMKKVCGEPFPALGEEVKTFRQEVQEVLEKCTHRDPGARYPNAQALVAALEELVRQLKLNPSISDPEAGTARTQSDLVSPPPAETMARARQELGKDGTDVLGDEGTTMTAVTIPLVPTAETAAVPVAASRKPWLIPLLVVIVIGAALGGMFLGPWSGRDPGTANPGSPGGSDPSSPPPDPYASALRLAQRGDTVPAVLELQKLFDKDPSRVDVRGSLATLRRDLAQRYRGEGNLRLAYKEAALSQKLDSNQATDDLMREVRNDIEGAIRAGLRIQEPREGTVVTREKVTVRGSLNYRGVVHTLRVAGEKVDLDGGRFQAEARGLQDGRQSIAIEVIAEEASGPRVTRSVEVMVDVSPPQLTVKNGPGADEWVRSPVKFQGEASDTSGITLRIDERPVPVRDGRWTASLTLPDGVRTIAFTATDEAGRETRVERQIQVDTRAPEVTVVGADQGNIITAEETLRVEVNVVDQGEIADVLIAGERAEASGASRYSRTISLSEGKQRVRVVATDRAGNTGSATVNAVRDSALPRLSISELPALSAPGTVTLRGKVSDRSDCTVTVDGEEVAVLPDGTWVKRLSVERTSSFLIVVRDRAGNSVERNVTQTVEVKAVVAKPPSDPPKRPSVAEFEGFTTLQKNVQGHQEYRHDQTGIVMVLLPGGKTAIGAAPAERDSDPDEKPRHDVSLDPFLIAKYEVSQEQWAKIMVRNPSQLEGPRLPVESVSWRGASKYCESARPALSLPSEAQWEYACRAGTRGPFSFGDTISTDSANFDGSKPYGGPKGISRQRPVPVDSLDPNAFGLHNMHGNVWEWCVDQQDADFYGKPSSQVKNPVSRGGSSKRTLRGGGWRSSGSACRSAKRVWAPPSREDPELGFRPVYFPLPK